MLNITNTTNTTGIIGFTQSYLQALPTLVLQGNFFAILVASAIFLVGIFVINKVTDFLWHFIKKTIVLFITGLAVYYFGAEFYSRFTVHGLTVGTIVFGVLGVAIGLIGVSLAVKSWFGGVKKSYSKIRTGKIEETETGKLGETKTGKIEETKKEEESQTGIKELKDMLSFQMIRHDTNLLSILVYLVIGQFGIFSSPTIAPPNPTMGLILFGLFLLGSAFFVMQTYKNKRKGLSHLIIALIFGLVLSILLGHFWVGIEIKTLLSLGYFGTNCVIALITGMAISLIMGRK